MKTDTTKLDGVLLITPDVHYDKRGMYTESYNIDAYVQQGISQIWVQDDFSISYRGVLRGIHGDNETWKLVSCVSGSIQLVVVNWDPEHTQYKQHEVFWLTGDSYQQVLIPPKFGNGHLVLSEMAIFHYKQSTYYAPEKQFTIKYNDPELGIVWLGKDFVTSERDRGV